MTRTFLNGWRIAGWGALLALFLLPLIAMQLTAEVDWTGRDFVFVALLLAFLGLSVEFAVHGARSGPMRFGLLLAALAAVLTVWGNAAMGIIGAEDEPLNIAFPLMVAGGLLASAVSRFRPRAMQAITTVLAVAQIVMGVVATQAMPGHGVEWGLLGFFALLWGGASLAFRRASRG